MNKISLKLVSAVLSVCMLLTMVSCLFGITASAADTTYDSGNMPDWFFKPESWTNNYGDISTCSDGSILFTSTYSPILSVQKEVFSNDFGSDLTNTEISFDFKSNSDWSFYLRSNSDFTSGYIIGCSSSSSLYIKKIESTNSLAHCDSKQFASFNYNEWHRYSIRFDDYEDYTAITVKVDGRKIPFCEGFAYVSTGTSRGFHDLDVYDKNVTVVDGALLDYNPIRNSANTYIKVFPGRDGNTIINPYGTMYFRSVDTDLTDKTDPFRIALIGDSITHAAASDELEVTYDKVLNGLLGENYDVYNGGVSGATAARYDNIGGYKPYKYENQFGYTKNFDADLVISMLGTNDAYFCHEEVDGEKILLEGDALANIEGTYKYAYKEILNAYINKGIQVVICSSPYSCSGTRLPEAVKLTVQWAKDIADELGLPFIDLYTYTDGHDDWLSDKTHPTGEGKRYYAQYVYDFLTTSDAVTLTKTNEDLTVPDFTAEVEAHKTILTSFDGAISADTFYASKYDTSKASQYIKWIDGTMQANFGAVSKDSFNLGNNWTVTFSNELPSVTYDTVYNGEHSWSRYRHSTFKVGGLTLMIYHLTNGTDSYNYYAYRLFMFNDEIAEPCITDSYNVKASYSIDYNNGTVKIVRTSDDTVLFDIDSSSVYKVVGNNYSFDNTGISLFGYEYNKNSYWYSMTVATGTNPEAKYNISSSEHGHIEYAGSQFDNTMTHYVGEKLTLNAVVDDFGYAFAKWVDADGNKITNNPVYTITLDEGSNYLHAVFEEYKPYGEISLTATEGGSVTINGAEYDKNNDYEVGTKITLGAVADAGYEFLYWTNSSGNILSTDAEFETTVPKLADFKAVFIKSDSSTVRVLFSNRVGAIVATQDVTAGTAITLPSLPTAYGYTCNGWIIGDEIKAAGDTVTVNENCIIRADYTAAPVKYTVTVSAGTVNGSESGTFTYNTKVTVLFDEATLSDGEVFYGWHVDGTNNKNSIISHSKEYVFYVGADVNLSAVISTESAEAAPIIDVTNVSAVTEGKYITFLTERSVSTGYTLVESGVIYTADENKTDLITLDNVGGNIYLRKAVNTAPNGQFRMTVGSRDGSAITVYLVAYMTYIDKYGEYFTVYSDVYNGTTSSYSGSQDIIDEKNDNF